MGGAKDRPGFIYYPDISHHNVVEGRRFCTWKQTQLSGEETGGLMTKNVDTGSGGRYTIFEQKEEKRTIEDYKGI